MNAVGKLRKRQIVLVVFADKLVYFRDSGGIAVRLPMSGFRGFHTEVLVHDVHDLVDHLPVAQLVPELALGIVFDKAGDRLAQQLERGKVSLKNAVAHKIRVLGKRKRSFKEPLVKLIGSDKGMGGAGIDGKHIVGFGGKNFVSDTNPAASGQNHIQFKQRMGMRFDDSDGTQRRAKRISLVIADDRIGLGNSGIDSFALIIP